MLQKTSSLLAGLIFSAASFAQIADKTPNIIPQSPQNAALFRYTETPVSYYNGTVGTDISIYEIRVGNYKLPISLSYHSGGIKVNEEATWVGLGWSLNAGGVISENVVGKRDAEDAITANYMKYNITPNRPNGRNGQPMNVIERGVCFPDYNGVMRNFLCGKRSEIQLSGTIDQVLDKASSEFDKLKAANLAAVKNIKKEDYIKNVFNKAMAEVGKKIPSDPEADANKRAAMKLGGEKNMPYTNHVYPIKLN